MSQAGGFAEQGIQGIVNSVTGGTGITASPTSGNVVVSLSTPVSVANGGTGDSSFTPYSVITGGTTSTGPLQNVSGVGTAHQVLTSNGAAALPTWQTPSATYVLGGNGTSAPAAGYIGEQIRSFIPIASSISPATNTPANLTNITLTPGVWDMSSVVQMNNAAEELNQGVTGISTTSATVDNTLYGDANVDMVMAGLSTGMTLVIPSYRVVISTSTTYYLVVVASFSAGSSVIYGRLSATRVG